MSRSFTDLFGGASHARVFDFLAEAEDRDRTITEITRGCDVARPTVYKVVDDFLDNEVIVKTRTVGNSRFFQLNLDNAVVQDLLRVLKPTDFEDLDVVVPSGPESSERVRTGKRSRQQR